MLINDNIDIVPVTDEHMSESKKSLPDAKYNECKCDKANVIHIR